jgi:hypothetical protein
MENNASYWICDWAKLRQDEVIQLPDDYKIHQDFSKQMSEDDVKSAFSQIHSIFVNIYGDITKFPEEFCMPLHLKDKYRFFSQQWRDSGNAPYRPFMLLYYLFISGEVENQTIKVSSDKFKKMNTVKQIHSLFKKLEDYGFHFEGLKNYKLSKDDITISYSDNAAILLVLKILADKAFNTNRIGDFLCCHFRMLQDDMNTANYGLGADHVADRVHTEVEKAFVYKMDETLMSMGIVRKPYGGYECHGLAYYDSEKVMNSKGPYLFRIVSRSTDIVGSISETEKMLLLLRIRNVANCIQHLNTCPDSVKDIFRHSDEGCSKRPCNMGVAYEFEGKSCWRCGCYAPAFKFKPKIQDIPHYIKLVELGSKK